MNRRSYLISSLFKLRSISMMFAVMLMAVPLALSARSIVGRPPTPWKPTISNSRRNAQTVTVKGGKVWGQNDSEVRKAGKADESISTVKRSFTRTCSGNCLLRQNEVSIYIYVNEVPENYTGVYSYQDPIIEDGLGNLVGTVGSNNDIYNSAGTVIGYITIAAN